MARVVSDWTRVTMLQTLQDGDGTGFGSDWLLALDTVYKTDVATGTERGVQCTASDGTRVTTLQKNKRDLRELAKRYG